MQILCRSFGPLQTNSYLLLDPPSQEAVWIDPAPGSHALLEELPPSYRLKQILLTHSHWDHIADLGVAVRTHATPVSVHEADSGNLKAPGSDGLPWPANIARPDIDSWQLLHEGDSWYLGQSVFQVWHTPGHSPGSCCFYCVQEQLLISGDTLFAFGYGRVDLAGSDARAMRASLRRLKELPAATRVHPGHGPSAPLAQLQWLKELLG